MGFFKSLTPEKALTRTYYAPDGGVLTYEVDNLNRVLVSEELLLELLTYRYGSITPTNPKENTNGN